MIRDVAYAFLELATLALFFAMVFTVAIGVQ